MPEVYKTVILVAHIAVVVGLSLVVLLIPKAPEKTVVTGVVAILANETHAISHTERFVNFSDGSVGHFYAHLNASADVAADHTACCKYLGDRAHWRTRDEPYTIYQGGSLNIIMGRVAANWRDALNGINIFGQAIASSLALTNEALTSPSTGNSVGWSKITWPGVEDGSILGVTYVLYATTQKQHIVKFGVAFNTDAELCDAAHNANCYDTESVCTHECGHVLGLADLYSGSCSTAVMYGYLSRGDTRDRNIPYIDRQCGQELYDSLPLNGEDSDPLDENSSGKKAAALYVISFVAFALLWP